MTGGMTHLGVDLRLQDGEWSEHITRPVQHGYIERIGNLPHGMASGAPAVQLLVRLDDGTTVVAETSWRLLRLAARALEAAWPEESGE